MVVLCQHQIKAVRQIVFKPTVQDKRRFTMKKVLSMILALSMMLSLAVILPAQAEITDLLDYQTIANEMETFCYQYSQKAVDLNVLSNCYDHLLTNDPNGGLQPAVAYEWGVDETGLVWTFKLNEGIKWVDYQGNVKADVIVVLFDLFECGKQLSDTLIIHHSAHKKKSCFTVILGILTEGMLFKIYT